VWRTGTTAEIGTLQARLWQRGSRAIGSVQATPAYTGRMFVETITSPRDEWERWNERLRIFIDPPDALVASVAWDSGDGNVTAVNVWDSAEAVGDFFVARTHAALQELGEPTAKPTRHGRPVAIYLRPPK